MFDSIALDSFQLDLANRALIQLDELGQSALEVMTSGGKSYIAAYIMSEYLSKNIGGRILWIAPKSAINNVKNKLMRNLALKNNVVYTGYEELSRGDNNIYTNEFDEYTGYDEGNISNKKSRIIDLSNIKLVVLDECHKALANKTFKNLTNLLDGLSDANRLVMSATPVRYNGEDSFKVLAPNVAEPIRFNLNDAAEHDLLPKIVYVVTNSEISDSDLEDLKRYEKLASQNATAKELYNTVHKQFESYRFDIETDLDKLLLLNLGEHTDTEISGERHIAFFNTIEELQSMHDIIKMAFKKCYPNCEINILEYHSKQSDAVNKDVFKQFVVDDPEVNRIDILMSVDKATESIHPDNIKSVMMFRGTQSIRVYLQQIGRGIMLKKYHPGDIVLFDFTDSLSVLGTHETSNETDDITDFASLKSSVISQFGYFKGLETKLGSEEIQRSLEALSIIQRMAIADKTIKHIKRMKCVYQKLLVDKGIRKPTENAYIMIDNIIDEVQFTDIDPDSGFNLKSIWKKDKDSFIRFCENLKRNYSDVQNDFWGKQIALSDESLDEMNKLGHTAYLKSGNRDITEDYINDIDYIYEAIKKSNGIENCTNTHAKSKLKKLKLAFASGRLTHNICIYADRKGVIIDKSDIINICSSDSEKDIIKQIKSTVKDMNSIIEDIQNGGVSYNKWLRARAKADVVARMYRDTEVGRICIPSYEQEYKHVTTLYKIDTADLENGARLIGIWIDYKLEHEFSRIQEDYIFDHYNFDNFSDYEKCIIDILKIDKKSFDDVVNRTSFIRKYNAAISGSIDDIKELVRSKGTFSDMVRSGLLHDSKFVLAVLSLQKLDTKEYIINKVKIVNKDNESQFLADINEALKENKIDQLELVLAAFRDYDRALASEILSVSDEEFEGFANNIAVVSALTTLVTRCSQINNCTKDSIKILVKVNNLDDTYRYRLNKLIELAEACHK